MLTADLRSRKVSDVENVIDRILEVRVHVGVSVGKRADDRVETSVG